MNSDFESTQLAAIYNDVFVGSERQWRRIHLKIMIAMSIIIVLVEAFMGLLLRKIDLSDAVIRTWYLNFFIAPLITYAVINAATICIYRFSGLSGKVMNYCISFGFSCLCIAICFFHNYFVMVYAAAILSIVMTTLYGDQRLTRTIGFILIFASLINSMIGFWDPTIPRNRTYLINTGIAVVIELCTYLICVKIVHWENRRREGIVFRQMEIEALRKTVAIDDLTKIGNRLGLRQYIDKYKYKSDLAYVMIDIDHFKQANDKWGHLAGDDILKTLGKILLSLESPICGSFRYGGDEFLLVFKDYTEEGIKKSARIYTADSRSLCQRR